MMYANFLNKPLFWGVPTDHEYFNRYEMAKMILLFYYTLFTNNFTICIGLYTNSTNIFIFLTHCQVVANDNVHA